MDLGGPALATTVGAPASATLGRGLGSGTRVGFASACFAAEREDPVGFFAAGAGLADVGFAASAFADGAGAGTTTPDAASRSTAILEVVKRRRRGR